MASSASLTSADFLTNKAPFQQEKLLRQIYDSQPVDNHRNTLWKSGRFDRYAPYITYTLIRKMNPLPHKLICKITVQRRICLRDTSRTNLDNGFISRHGSNDRGFKTHGLLSILSKVQPERDSIPRITIPYRFKKTIPPSVPSRNSCFSSGAGRPI